jgi:hypothetical protein
MTNLLFCIDCGRALENFQQNSCHLCIICESKKESDLHTGSTYFRLSVIEKDSEFKIG